ncbi:MAG: hypothetical protein US70_C0012G0017 [Parcubacteria group bacterium GW2011_GWD2_38_11]|nr:MAG: hypothetical protein US70_C0012G0017 [Parcubacteria group bacterium GW2011_GWD2_38_11]
MDKRIKIVLGVVIFLGVVSGVFLLFAKKKPATVAAPKTIAASAEVKPLKPVASTQNNAVAPKKTTTPQVTSEQRKKAIRSQWEQCKGKTMAGGTNLFWTVKILEGIPVGGTYAKGNLDGDVAYPVRVIIKSDSQIIDKIKAMLVVEKSAFLRGTCTEVGPDGSVVLQAF